MKFFLSAVLLIATMAAVNAAVAINSAPDLKEYLIDKLMDQAPVFKQQAGADYGTVEQDGDYGTIEQDGDYGTIEQDDDYGTIEQDGDYGTIEQDGDYGTIEQDGDYGTIEQDGDYGTIEQDGDYMFDADNLAKVMADPLFSRLSRMPQKARVQFWGLVKGIGDFLQSAFPPQRAARRRGGRRPALRRRGGRRRGGQRRGRKARRG